MNNRVLVAYATKHGATRGIADCIAEELRGAGLDVAIAEVREVRDLAPYDAVVLGSALYAGNWRSEAVAFVKRHRAELATRPVWLFSSGPLDTETDPAAVEMTKSVAKATSRLAPVDHETFGGALLPGTPGFIEGLMLRNRSGDFRDWEHVREWSRGIAAELKAGIVATA
jgi:menaquinone-dependent protoporphyrinogen oxidase